MKDFGPWPTPPRVLADLRHVTPIDQLPWPTPPRVLDQPPAGPVLCLAPHPDDAVLGCGGALALHARAGDPVHLVWVFDGAAGLAGAQRRERAALREREARAGAALLGVTSCEAWGLPEGHRPSPHDLEQGAFRLAALLAARRPATVYAPWPGEQHVDHATVARALHLALARLDAPPRVLEYEVWTPLVPTDVLDVSAVFEIKRAALRAHASQLAEAPLEAACEGLGRHRALFLGKGASHGEALRDAGRHGCCDSPPTPGNSMLLPIPHRAPAAPERRALPENL